MDINLNSEIKRLKNLKNYKDYDDATIEKVAKNNLKVKEFKLNPLFAYPGKDETIAKLVQADQEAAEIKFKSYIDSYDIESNNDIDTLRSLVFNEVLETKIQREIGEQFQEGKNPGDRLTSQLLDLQNQKADLKIKLGIDKTEIRDTDLTYLQKLEKRMQNYINENRHEFTIACGCCGEMLLLNRRVKDFDSIKHPWFAGRWFFNLPLFKLVKDGIITKEQAWAVMCGSAKGSDTKPAFNKEYCTDYIDYCLDHWAEIVSHLENNGK